MKIKKLIATMLAFLLLMTVGLTACSTPTDGGDNNKPPAGTDGAGTQDDDDKDGVGAKDDDDKKDGENVEDKDDEEAKDKDGE